MTGSRAAVLTAGAALVFLACWATLHHAWYGRNQLVDTPVYERYGDAIAAGQVPYRDFSLEYPPGALAAFIAPELTAEPRDSRAYAQSFEKWMAGCGMVLTLLVGAGLWVRRVSFLRAAVSLGLVAVSPLLLGSVMLSRFDLLPAALTAGAVAALLAEFELVAGVVLGLAIAVKLYPLVLVPVGVAWLWRRQARWRALAWLGVAFWTVAAVFVPFAILSPGGLAHSLAEQLRRPVQVESLPAAFLLAAHHLAGLGLHPSTSHGSQNFVGGTATTVGAVSTALGLALLLVVWTQFARGPATRTQLVAAATASVAVVVAFSRVFSPQFLIWLVPLVALTADVAAIALLAAALVLTQIWFPQRYWELALHAHAFESWLVVARDVVVVALAVVLARSLLQHDGLGESRPARKALEPVGGQVET